MLKDKLDDMEIEKDMNERTKPIHIELTDKT